MYMFVFGNICTFHTSLFTAIYFSVTKFKVKFVGKGEEVRRKSNNLQNYTKDLVQI